MAVIDISNAAGQGIDMRYDYFGLASVGDSIELVSDTFDGYSGLATVLNYSSPYADQFDLYYHAVGGGYYELDTVRVGWGGQAIFEATGLSLVGSAEQVATLSFSYQDALSGSDRFYGNDYRDYIAGYNGNDTIYSYAGNDGVSGDAGNDKLYAGQGHDTVYGGTGNDYLYGGSGNDRLYGGSGADAFVFDFKPNASTNKDIIADFRVIDDTVRLDNAVFTRAGSNGAFSSAAFWSNNTGKAHDTSDRVIYDRDSGVLYYDADGTGSGASIAFATISKNLILTYKDFYII